MRKTNWVVQTRHGRDYSLPGPGDIMLFKTKWLAMEAADDWTYHLDPTEYDQVGPLQVRKVVFAAYDYAGDPTVVAPAEEEELEFAGYYEPLVE